MRHTVIAWVLALIAVGGATAYGAGWIPGLGVAIIVGGLWLGH
jgi:hypothetical protein